MNELKQENRCVVKDEMTDMQEKNTVLESDVLEDSNILKKDINDHDSCIRKYDLLIKNILKSIFQTRLFILLTGILILLKTILLYKTAIFVTEPFEFYYTPMAATFICIFLTLPMLLKNKLRFWTTIIINFIISLLLFVNELYYSYSANLVSISQISNLQYGREISLALPNLLHIRQCLYFIDIIFIVILYFSFRINREFKINNSLKTNTDKDYEKTEKNIKGKLFQHFKKQYKKHYNMKQYIPGIIYLICMTFLALNPVKSWLEEAQSYQYNKVMQIEASSIYGYQFLDIKNNLNMKKNVKYKTKTEMMEAYNTLKQKYENKYTSQYNLEGIAKDKSVILLQLESVQNFVVNRKINGKEITPNLNKFLKENIELTNMQNQSYSSTADSEFTVMNSLYPLENGMCFAQYSSNDYNNIYQNFKKNDYTTTYIHGNEGSFWNRQAVYSRLKIDNLLFDDIFDENVERISGYVSDEHVYRKIVDEIKKYNDKFFVSIVASSSHTAFDLPGIENKERKVNIDVGEQFKDTYFGNYLEAVNYADYAFGIFIDELKKADLYDDTVIIVYGDHAGLQMYNWEMQDFIKEQRELNDIQTQINYSNVLCGMKIPGVGSMQIDKPTSKLDIKPTLMEICGIEDEFSLGQSVFSDKDFVCINNGKIITDKYFYDGDWYSIQTGEQLNIDNVSDDQLAKLNEYSDCLQKELDISLSVNILNLLKNK